MIPFQSTGYSVLPRDEERLAALRRSKEETRKREEERKRRCAEKAAEADRGRFRDIDVDEGGMVGPETGGVSVSPPPPENLPEQLRPPGFGGYGKDPLWELDTDDLPPELRYRPDPKNLTGHGFVEPAAPMLFEDFERAVHGTRSSWRAVR